jgi:outer membrane protein
MQFITRFFTTVLLLILCHTSYATNLLQAYQQALESDPAFQAAVAEYYATRQNIPLNAANLLPSVTATMGRTGDITTNEVRGRVETRIDAFTVNLIQPVLDFSAWKRLEAAQTETKAAYSTLLSAKQDLILRTAQSYFDVLLAKDTLAFILDEKKFVAQQLAQTRERFKVGLDAITSVYDAQAAYDQITASEIGARNNLENALEILGEITGTVYTDLASLDGNIPLVRPTPSNADAWVAQARTDNFNLQTARLNAEVARKNVQVAKAARYPTITATVSRDFRKFTQNQAATFFPGETQSLSGVLEANIPILLGGSIYANIKKARHLYDQAKAELERTHRNVVSVTNRAFNNVISGISKIKADNEAIKSRRAALESTQEAFKVGTRTMVDVLDDQRSLTRELRSFAEDQYAYINNLFILKAKVGRLTEEDVVKINTWLEK